MIGKIALLALYFGFATCAYAQPPGGTVRANAAHGTAHGPHVIESAAKATLEKDAIRLMLPFNEPAGAGVRVVAWLLSPQDETSSETANVKAGAHDVEIALAWPKGKQKIDVKDAAWYRIGYRVEMQGAESAHGILSIGAITSKLIALRIAYSSEIGLGEAISARVIALNPVTGKQLAGVALKATLGNEDAEPGKEKSAVREAITGRNGEAVLNFALMGEAGDELELKVVGTLTDAKGALAHDELKGEIRVLNLTAVHVEMDKPLHRPGEVVHLRGVAIRPNVSVAANEPLTLTINDPDGKTLVETKLKTDRFGIAQYDWKTAAQMALGDYEATLSINDSSDGWVGAQKIRIQRYELPEFSVSATPDRPYYMDGQTPHVKIHAGYLFGEPVAQGSVRIVRTDDAEWNPKTGREEKPHDPEAAAALDNNGDAILSLAVADEFTEMKGSDWERYRDVTFRAMVTDATTGRTEPVNFAIRLALEPVHIYVDPIGSDAREGEYIIATQYPDGTPAPCRLTLDWMDDESVVARAAAVSTNRYGLAKVTLHYPPDAIGEDADNPELRITARDKEGRLSHFDDSLYINHPDHIWISLDHTLLAPEQAIEGTIHATPGEEIDIDVLTATSIIEHLQIRMMGREQAFTVPARPSFRGPITLRAYSMQAEMDEESSYISQGATRTVLYPEDRSLHAQVNGLKASYAPGAEVTAGLALRDAANGPLRGVFGVSVFDAAVEQRAITEEEANDRWFGKEHWWLDVARVGDVTLDSLNKTDMSHPVANDLDLAAERLLLDSFFAYVEIASTDESKVRGEYEKQMESDMRPLADAIRNADPENLPSTAKDLKEFAAKAGLAEGILLDPWNTPYEAKLGEQGNDDVLTLTAAGPDKEFGTRDDLSIPLVQRNVFAVPGERLDKLLQQAVVAGQPLPANVDALKRFALAGGLNLDLAAQHTLQSDGKPFIYEIDESRSTYFVNVERSKYDVVWHSKPVDYFAATAAKLRAAIESWTAAGHPFPETKDDALRAFAAASIDFGILRDPLGRPFELAAERELSYASIDKVKAGASVTSEPEKVTITTQAIKIRRTDEKGAALPFDEVAEFSNMLSLQSGKDVVPVAVKSGTFQGNTGAIGGTVTDASGAVIPNAKVTVQSQSGGVAVVAITLSTGTYVVPDLAPGFYKIRIAAKGFESFYLTDVHVASSAITTVDARLQVGAETMTVTVSATATDVATENAEHTDVVTTGDLKRLVKTPQGSVTISEQTMTPRLRHFFAETAYWEPSLETNSGGRVTVKFTLPDSLTTWKLHAVGSTEDGRITSVDQAFKTFMPFMVDPEAPQTLTVGDAIWLPVNLRNYTDHAVSLPVTVKPADWFTLTTPAVMSATVPSNGSTPMMVGMRASSAVEAGPLRITAANAHEGDAVEKTVNVHPDGEARSVTTSELLRGGATNMVMLNLPADAIASSVHAQLLLYPNLGANVYHAMKAVLERPYGCAEQTISAAYPSLFFLEMEEAAQHESATKEEAQGYLQAGYDRLLGYFNAAGGVTYWGGNDTTADAALTAYAVEFLAEAKPYVDVDPARIVSAMEWLLAQQDKEGAWKPRYGDYSARESLYIASALAYAISTADLSAAPKNLPERVKKAIAQAQEYATHSVLAQHDPYANALRLSLAAAYGDTASIDRLRKQLIAAAQNSRDGAYWEFDGVSPFYGWGEGGRLETTALALAALHVAGNESDGKLEDEALLYLLNNRDGYGVWMSGQATMLVLKVLLPIAIQQLRSASSGDFTVTVNGKPLSTAQAAAIKADEEMADAPRTIDLSEMIHEGANTLEFSGTSGTATANAQLTAWFYVPWSQESAGQTKTTVPGKDFGLDFGYECDAVGGKAGQPITCSVNARRFGSQSYGMMLAEVGLPPGADVDRASLAKLLDDWTIDRYDLEPDRIVFYLWSSAAEGEKFTFRFTPRYAIRAKAAPAKLTDYYNPDLNAVLAPQLFNIGGTLPH